MRVLHRGVAAALLLAVAGCTPAPQAGGEDIGSVRAESGRQSAGTKSGPSGDQSGPVATPPAVALPPIPEAIAEQVADGLIRVEFAAGDVIDRAGAYFLNTVTGRGEGWVPVDAPQTSWYAWVSDDNRFIATWNYWAEHDYLVDRKMGATWRWDATRFRLLLAGERGSLFAEVAGGEARTRVDSGRVVWADSDMRTVYTFTLPGDEPSIRGALLAPGGEKAAVMLRHGELVLLDLVSGSSRTLAAWDLVPEAWPSVQPSGDRLLVTIIRSSGAQMPTPPGWDERVILLDWDGKTVADIAVPGTRASFSPDGRWMTWEEWPADWLAPMTVVADAATLEPRLRAFGVTTCFATMSSGGRRWLSDSSGLVVDTSDGYRLLTVEGELRALPALSRPDWRGEPQPAPDDPDLFALGRIAVSDGAGTRQLGIALEGYVTPYHLDPWGRDSTEMRFVLPPKPGGGACGERPPMEAAVQVPAGPMPEYPLVVDGVEGCLPLHPGAYGTEEACLPNGTRLTVYRRTDHSAVNWYMQTWHLWVETEDGLIGEISLEGNPLRWAVGQGGDAGNTRGVSGELLRSPL